MTLVLTCVSVDKMCDFGPRLGLLSAALALHVVGIVMYLLSSCGCSLFLCCCSGSCCWRAIHAMTVLGFSLLFWLLGISMNKIIYPQTHFLLTANFLLLFLSDDERI